MNRLLRLGLVGLVALNLVFVELTGAVDPRWLIALFAFTLSAPWTSRFRDSRIWCALWNSGVLITFTLLVRDAVTTGPKQLLEDGMTLAAFCQVHLLNVIQNERRADLLFFNSFLIAIVTSFFCQDITFSLTFAAWVVVFVTTLSLSHESRDLPPWTVVRDAVRRAGVVLCGTLLVFGVWPRDFRRPGLVDDALFLQGLDDGSQVGFSEKVDLGRSSHVTVSERVTLTATLESGRREDVPSHWRGATLDIWDGRGWSSLPGTGRASQVEVAWEKAGPGKWIGPRGTARAILRVSNVDTASRRLFAPLETLSLTVLEPGDIENVIPAFDGNFVRLPSGANTPCWQIDCGIAEPVERHVDRPRLSRFLHVDRNDPRVVPPVLFVMLAEATRGLTAAASNDQVVQRCRDLLASRFGYLEPGRQGAAADLAEFLDGDAPAHCEYFATALALMLRLRDVPCRVVTGYLAHEWKPDGRTLVVRDSDAHAWVEVFDARRGWYAVDATPETSADASGFAAWIDSLGKAVSSAWTAVTTFDAERRQALIDWFAALPAELADATTGHPLPTVALLLFVAALLVRRRSRRRSDRAILAYRRCLARLRLVRRPTETPRELLERTRREGRFDADRLHRLELATEAHERARFLVLRGDDGADRTHRLRCRTETPSC
ncbi:MAG: transglutaminaseTgpA domain-containing protein [Planctomycetota bacterium]